MTRLIANIGIALFVLWTIAVAGAAFLDITIYFPCIISNVEDIPIYRLQSLRIAILLTFAHYGVLHLIGKNGQYLPIHFLSQFLFYLVLAGGIILYVMSMPVEEYVMLLIVSIVWSLCIVASRPLNRDLFRNK